jgi:hypothetical protein
MPSRESPIVDSISMSLALKGSLRLADYILLGTSVFAFLLLAGAWAFRLRIFPLNLTGEVAHSTRMEAPSRRSSQRHCDSASGSPINLQETRVDLPANVLIRSSGTAQSSKLSFDDFLAETTLTVT